MHDTAMINGASFFNVYSPAFAQGPQTRVVEIGSQDVNGSLREACPRAFHYTGVDFVAGKGVDMVLQDPYALPFEAGSTDIVVSSSCFEHSQMFWLVFLEILRILKPGGLFYLNVPSNGAFHRYPVDCWRFYPDSGGALVAWARRNGMQAALLESFVSDQRAHGWNDFVAVFLKDESQLTLHPRRILEQRTDVKNGIMHGHPSFINATADSEELHRLKAMRALLKV